MALPCLIDLSLLQEPSQKGKLAFYYIISTKKQSERTVNLMVLWLAFSTNIILEMYTFTRFTMGDVHKFTGKYTISHIYRNRHRARCCVHAVCVCVCCTPLRRPQHVSRVSPLKLQFYPASRTSPSPCLFPLLPPAPSSLLLMYGMSTLIWSVFVKVTVIKFHWFPGD